MSVASSETELWNRRYSGSDYYHGTEPNAFLVEHADLLSSPVLSLAEGEGRNAVFLAGRGLDVLGVDISAAGLAKADRLAAERGVRIRTQVADLADYDPGRQRFGSIVSICANLPSAVRRRLNPLLERALLPGGVVVLEGHSEAQFERSSGGPPDPDMLLSADKIRAEWLGLEVVWLRELEREVCEHRGRRGMAAVVQFVGRKRQP